MLATRRTLGHSKRREASARPRCRVYAGGAVTRRSSSRVLWARSAQPVASSTRCAEWLGAAVTLAAIAGWGTLLMLVGG
jgi:hypothetical protein